MTLSDAFFAGSNVQARKVKLPDGSEHDLHFKQLSVAEFRRFQLSESSDDMDERAGSMARLIHMSLCTPEGKQALTYEKAKQLNTQAANALVAAVLDVLGVGKEKKG
jgi:hypothetical protein